MSRTVLYPCRTQLSPRRVRGIVAAFVTTFLWLAPISSARADFTQPGDSERATSKTSMLELVGLGGIYMGFGYDGGLNGFGVVADARVRGVWKRRVLGRLRVAAMSPLDTSTGAYELGGTVGLAFWSQGWSAERGAKLVLVKGDPRLVHDRSGRQWIQWTKQDVRPSGRLVAVHWRAAFVTMGLRSLVFNGNENGSRHETPEPSNVLRLGPAYHVAGCHGHLSVELSGVYDVNREAKGVDAEVTLRRRRFMVRVAAGAIYDFGLHTQFSLGASL